MSKSNPNTMINSISLTTVDGRVIERSWRRLAAEQPKMRKQYMKMRRQDQRNRVTMEPFFVRPHMPKGRKGDPATLIWFDTKKRFHPTKGARPLTEYERDRELQATK